MALHVGRIVEEQKNYFLADSGEMVIRCSIRGSLKNKKVRICTGDLVDIELTNHDSPEGVIIHVHDRQSYLKRPALANLKQLFIVTTYKQPELDLESLDRLLFCSEVYQIPAVIVFNKSDILDDSSLTHLDSIRAHYATTGYRTILTSAYTGQGIEELSLVCENQISAFTGLSGVGKSSLLSLIFPGRSFKTAVVSGSNGRGTHTTTTVTLIPFMNGYIADTPGLSHIDIPSVDESDVTLFFPELARVTGQCRFNNCLHKDEPGCAVRELIDNGAIASWRHLHFHKIYNEMQGIRRTYR